MRNCTKKRLVISRPEECDDLAGDTEINERMGRGDLWLIIVR